MLFVIFCLDKPGMEEKRQEIMAAHRAYIATNPIKVVMLGPLTSDDGNRSIGSLFIVEAEDRTAVESFQKNDPFVAADLWETNEIRAFSKRVDNRD